MAKPRFIPRFVWANLICTIQARRTTGFLNGTLAFSPQGTVFWTLTVWQDGAAMKRFRESGSHLKFIPKMADWGSEASTAAWKVVDGRLPTWDEAYEALRKCGRFAPVEAPNNNQRNGIVPPPSRVILTVPLLRRRVIQSSVYDRAKGRSEEAGRDSS
jgi:hypothetical protein